MSQATEQITKQFSNAANVRKIWSEIIFNVKENGARGNGTTIDTSYIQETINEANAAGGGVVFFPPGVYLTDKLVIPSNVTIRGAHRQKSVLRLVGNPSGPLLEISGTPTVAKENVVIEDITLQHNTSFVKVDELKGVMIRGYYTRYITVRNVNFLDISVYGILISQNGVDNSYGRSWDITNCTFNIGGASSKGVFCFDQGEYVTINDCIFHSLKNAVTASLSANLKILNSTIMSCGDFTNQIPSIYIYAESAVNSSKTIIANNAINHNQYVAIIVKGQSAFNHGVLINGNNVLVNENNNNGIELRGVRGAIVTNNRIRPGTTTYGSGLYLADEGVNIADQNIISNNIVLGGGLTGSFSGVNNLINNNITGIL